MKPIAYINSLRVNHAPSSITACRLFDSLYHQFNHQTCPENNIIVSHGTAIKCFLALWFLWNVEYLSRWDNCLIAM